MGKAWIRQEVKKDKVAEAVDRAVAVTRAHPERVAWAAGGVLAAVLAGVYFAMRFSDIRNQAWAQLASAENQLRSGQNGLPALDQVMSQYPGQPAADYAGILQGDLLYFSGEYAKAADVYRRALSDAKPNARPFALCDLGLALEAAGKPNEAIDQFKAFLDQYPDHFLSPEAHYALARSQESAGMKDSAKATYEKVALLYPDTEWARQAKLKTGAAPAQMAPPSAAASRTPPPLLRAPAPRTPAPATSK